MIKGIELVLIVLFLVSSPIPVSGIDSSSINTSQGSINNTADLPKSPSENIPTTEETMPGNKSEGLSLKDIVSIIGGILGIAVIILKIIPWLFPNAPDTIRIKIIGILRKIKPSLNVPERESNNSGPEKENPKSLIRLPYPPNLNFTGRQELLSSLAQTLVQAVSRPKIYALVGNGGMGKTQIALQHAYNPEHEFKYVWWLRSEEPATLLEDYISIARDHHLPGWDLRDTDKTVKTVKLWLEGQCDSRWLLVFDNAKERKDLERYVPVAGNGQIIVTSRLSVWDGFARLLEVGVFQREKMEGESVDFLLKRTGKDDRKGAADLAAELGDLPLALEQAGAYIKESGISFADYLVRLKENRRELLSKGKPLNYPDSVATTWEISFRAVQKENPAAGDLLSLLAFLAPDAIPRDLLEKGAGLLPEPLSSCVQNSGQLDDCIALLNRYSLIGAADNLFSIHRLVQAVVQDRLSPEDQRIWAEFALRMVHDAFSFSQLDMESWEKCSKLFSHAVSASEHAERLAVSSMETANLLNSLGNYLHNRMELASAKAILERALAIDENAFGKDHTSVAIDVNNLGSVLQDQGDLEGARKCLERALAIDEKALGPEHTSVASIANNLGTVLQDQGDLEGAKECFQRALAIDEKAFGPEHTKVAIRVNNLGLVLKDQGDLEGARKCLERALAIDEKALGPEHTGVASIANNLGSVLQDQGDLEGARKCFERALAIDEKALGPDHTGVASIANNLGSVLKDQGDLEGARKCFERALAIDEKALGPDHTRVAIRVNNLGSVLQDQGDLEGARRCAGRALGIFESRLGKDHPNSILARSNLRMLQK
jgi:tetratricopeptide (TPR) repeat protein